jgi:hypothetical protein
MSAVPDYIDSVLKEWESIAYFAYDGFERHGRGAVDVERNNSGTVRFTYAPAEFFRHQRQTDVVRLLELYDPAAEFVVCFEESPAATRTLRIRTPENGQGPKGIWFFKVLGLINEQPEALPDYLPQWFFRALEDLERAKRKEEA